MSKARAHRFCIQVERLGDLRDRQGAPLTFEVENHDDLLEIIGRVSAGTTFTRNQASALALGVKLLGSVALEHRHDPLFADIQPALRAFIGDLKSRVATSIRLAAAPN